MNKSVHTSAECKVPSSCTSPWSWVWSPGLSSTSPFCLQMVDVFTAHQLLPSSLPCWRRGGDRGRTELVAAWHSGVPRKPSFAPQSCPLLYHTLLKKLREIHFLNTELWLVAVPCPLPEYWVHLYLNLWKPGNTGLSYTPVPPTTLTMLTFSEPPTCSWQTFVALCLSRYYGTLWEYSIWVQRRNHQCVSSLRQKLHLTQS